jgi:hypothetical protein
MFAAQYVLPGRAGTASQRSTLHAQRASGPKVCAQEGEPLILGGFMAAVLAPR